MDDEWADDVLDEHARDGEHMDDEQLLVHRTEARLRYAVDLHMNSVVSLRADDAEAIGFLRGELYDDEEIAEIFRRVQWYEERSRQERDST